MPAQIPIALDTALKTDLPTPSAHKLDWMVSRGLTDYDDAMAAMEARIAAIHNGTAGEMIWLLEHPPVYTAGTSAKESDLLNPGDALIRHVGRGGEWTYHGPGQRVVYIMLDLNTRGQDVRRYVQHVEDFAITTLAQLGITADRRTGYPGVFVPSENGHTPPDKITAIGVRLTKWISWHGMAINLNPELSAFDGIVPCGIHDGGVTTINAHKPDVTLDDLDAALYASFADSFPF